MLLGLYWIFTSCGIASAARVYTFVRHYMGSGQVTPVCPVAGRCIGNLKVLVPLTGMTTVLACFGANALAASWMLYAVARAGRAGQGGSAASRAVERAAARPGNGRSGPIGLGTWQGSYLVAFSWTGQVIVLFILIPHLAVSLANPVCLLRYRRERFHWLTNAAVPALGLGIDGYVLYTAFFQTLLASRSNPAAASSG